MSNALQLRSLAIQVESHGAGGYWRGRPEGLEDRVVILRFDPETGHLSMDERFREEGTSVAGFSMAARAWPHGGTAAGRPHGAVFGRR